MRKLLKKDFFDVINLCIEEGTKLKAVKIVREQFSKKVSKEHGLINAKAVVDLFFMFPSILWLFCINGFSLSKPHQIVMVVANRTGVWKEKIRVSGDVVELRAAGKEIIQHYNNTMHKGEIKRSFRGIGFEYCSLEGEPKLLRL